MNRSGEATPPLRSALSSRTQARDITAAFTQAASALQTGQLVKDEFFTLFEAVGALEIMDSKMDSGFLAPGETLDDDYDVARELLPEEVLWIIDELLCHEMAWHKGHPLSQTLFTSIYLDRLLWPEPKTVEQAQFVKDDASSSTQCGGPWVQNVLRAYGLGLIKSCDLVFKQITSQHFYEEEDFVTQLYNRSLLFNIDASDITASLLSAEDFLSSQSTQDINETIRDALLDRLRSRRHFLAAVQTYHDNDVAHLTPHISSANFFACTDLIDDLIKQNSLGKPVKEAFSQKIQRRLASSVPPRPIVQMKFDDAIAQYRRLCSDAVDVLQVMDAKGPEHLLTLVWTIGSRKPEPSIYVRCVLQKLIFNDMVTVGAMSIKELVFDDLKAGVLPHSVLLDEQNASVEDQNDPRHAIALGMEDFVRKIAQPYLDVYKLPCLNRCRMRRNMCHTILEWDAIQVEAEELDNRLVAYTHEPPLILPSGEELYSFPLSSFLYGIKLDQMRQILQMGFELDIYAPNEVAGMYWYLAYICDTHLSHLDRTAIFIGRNEEQWMRTQKRFSAPPSPFASTIATIQRQKTRLRAVAALATTLHLLCILLTRHGHLPSQFSPEKSSYAKAQLSYELRIRPFLPISVPEIIPYATFQEQVTCTGERDEQILARAERAIDIGKKEWESILTGGILPKQDRDDTQWQERHQRLVTANTHPASLSPPPTQLDNHDLASSIAATSSSIESDWTNNVKACYRSSVATGVALAMTKDRVLGLGKTKKTAGVKVEVPGVGTKARFADLWCVPRVVPC